MQLIGRTVELLLSFFIAWDFGHGCYCCLKSAPESSRLFLKFLRDWFLHIDIILELPVSAASESVSLHVTQFQEIILKTTGKCWVNGFLTVLWQREVSKYIKFYILGTCEGGGNGECVVAWFSEEHVAQLQSHVREARVHKIIHMRRTVIFISSRREHCIKCKTTVKEICLMYLPALLKSFSKCP